MAGKKNRKRRTGSKKKVTKENINEGIVVCEEKKPKLDDDLEGQAEQSEKHAQEPNFETAIADTNSDVSEVEDLQTEENKYVPPFTRKANRKLHRDRCPVSPDVKTTRPKRPWNGSKQNSKEAQQSPGAQQTNDVTSTKDSPKVHLQCFTYAQVQFRRPVKRYNRPALKGGSSLVIIAATPRTLR